MNKHFTDQLSAGQVQVIKKGNASVAKLQQVIGDTLQEFSLGSKKKFPTTVTRGDNWLCIATAVGEVCISINFTEIRR